MSPAATRKGTGSRPILISRKSPPSVPTAPAGSSSFPVNDGPRLAVVPASAARDSRRQRPAVSRRRGLDGPLRREHRSVGAEERLWRGGGGRAPSPGGGGDARRAGRPA